MGKAKYSEELRAKAVELVISKGHTPQQVAQELGITSKTVRDWVQKHANNQRGDYLRIQELEQELRQVKRQLAESQEVVEILKKTAAILSKP